MDANFFGLTAAIALGLVLADELKRQIKSYRARRANETFKERREAEDRARKFSGI